MTKRLKSQLILLGAAVVIMTICNVASGGRLLTGKNITTIMMHAVFPTLAAWGMCFIFSGGLIDLSVGANILLSANVGALLACNLGWGYPGLIIGSVLCAVLCTEFTTHCAITLGIPAWIAGLGGALVLEAVLSQWSIVVAGKYAEKLPVMNAYRGLGKMPGAIILLVIGLIAAYLIFNKTTLGIHLQAVGANSHIAETMGINIRKTMIQATVIGGIFIGFASINAISSSGQMTSISGLNSLSTISKSLSATLLANSIVNIFTKPIGILLSSIVVAAMFNILTLFGVPSGTGQNICLAIVIVACGVLSNLKYRGVVK